MEALGRVGAQRALEPETRLQHALDLAYRHLGKRDRTVAQVRRHLEERGIDAPEVDAALRELRHAGYLDDARFARRFAEDRRHLDGWGARRIEQGLLAAGIERELAAGAAAERGAAGELDGAVDVLRQRFPHPPRDNRERNRALGLLVRRGYDFELACDAIRAHARGD